MQTKTLLYLGPAGSFSYIAAKKIYPDSNFVACKDFDEIFSEVLKNKNSIGIVPIENSITSSIHSNIDQLFNTNLKICGEVNMLINQCLIGLNNAKISQITTIYSHPKAIEQCSIFIKKYGFKTLEESSTAMSIKKIIENNDKRIAAIGSCSPDNPQSLKILKKNIQNYKNNYTRFIFLGNKKLDLNKQYSKATIVFEDNKIANNLLKLLNILSENNVKLTKIESRPIPQSTWSYKYLMDLELNTCSANSLTAILRSSIKKYKIIGFYNTFSSIDE